MQTGPTSVAAVPYVAAQCGMDELFPDAMPGPIGTPVLVKDIMLELNGILELANN